MRPRPSLALLPLLVLGSPVFAADFNVAAGQTQTITAGTYTYDHLIINAGSTLVIQGAVVLNVLDVQMDPTAVLTGKGQGFAGGLTAGSPNGTGPGGATSIGDGAAHGGLAGKKGGGTAGAIYDVTNAPSQAGSGGAYSGSGAGGGGGAALSIIASGNVQLQGNVDFSGADGANAGSGGGGGSGGALSISAPTTSGNAVVKVDGGKGGTGSPVGGGGAGGYFLRNASTSSTGAWTITASGGTGSGAGGQGVVNDFPAPAIRFIRDRFDLTYSAGTYTAVYLSANASLGLAASAHISTSALTLGTGAALTAAAGSSIGGSGSLSMASASTFDLEGSLKVGSVTSAGSLDVGSAASLTITGDLTLNAGSIDDADTGNFAFGGNLALNANAYLRITGHNISILNPLDLASGSTLILGDGTHLSAPSSAALTSGRTLTLGVGSSITLASGPLSISGTTVALGKDAALTVPGSLSISATSIPFAGAVILTVGTFSISAGATLNGTGGGYAAAQGPGAGESPIYNYGPGGGGHGGAGGIGNGCGGCGGHAGAGGGTYGSSTVPVTMGSGGGNGAPAYPAPGGAGGAALWIKATAAIQVDGLISADGAGGAVSGGPNYEGGGGGAGGSIYITGTDIGGTGTLSANGGAAGAGVFMEGGSGGGGRIALDLTDPSCSLEGLSIVKNAGFLPGYAYAGPNNPSPGPGSPGTLYDSCLPRVSVSSVTTSAEGDSGQQDANFLVSLSKANTQAGASVSWSTLSITAASPADYAAGSGTLSFALGELTKTVTVKVNGDTLNEVNETYAIGLSGEANLKVEAGSRYGYGTIIDDDPLPSLNISDFSAVEGNSGSTNFIFNVSLIPVSGRQVTVNYSTASGTASALDGDFLTAAGSLTFAAGVSERSLTITVYGDTKDEVDENFLVNLSGAVGAVVVDGSGLGTITNDDTGPTVAIGDVTKTEGTGASGTVFSFSVSLSAVSGKPVSVDFATSTTMTASAGDIQARSGTITFPVGTQFLSIPVSVTADSLNEATESFALSLSNPINASSISKAVGIGSIVDDDPVSLSIGNGSVTEGNSGTVSLTMTVSLSAASAQTIQVNWASVSGTADPANDYNSASGTLTFAPGATAQNVTITVNGDLVDELNETFSVLLSSPVNASVLSGTGTATIVDDDSSRISINDVSAIEGDSGTTAYGFTVSLDHPNDRTVTVNWSTADGTAVSSSDYQAVSSTTLSFPPFVTSLNVTVTGNTDTLAEADETFFVNLSGPVNASLLDGQGQGTITNDDSDPTIAIGDVTHLEGTGASGTVFSFSVSLSAVSGKVVTVNFATATTMTASSSDIQARTGTLTFPVGTQFLSIPVSVTADSLNEAIELFSLNLSGAVNASAITQGFGVGSILDDDPATVSIGNASVLEGDSGPAYLTFTVSLNGPSSQAIQVNWASLSGTADPANDYDSASGTLTFAPGVTAQNITITVNGDQVDELDEALSVQLSSPVIASIGTGVGIGTIVDDDTSQISVSDVAVAEGDSGTTPYAFTLSLSHPNDRAVSVNWSTADGTAVAPGDYQAVSISTVSFAPFVTSLQVTVTGNTDFLSEADETFFVNLASPVNAAILDGQGQGSILDDDAAHAPTISVVGNSVTEGDSGTQDLVFSVSLSAVSGQVVHVDYASADHSATAGSDYTASSGTLAFAPGQTVQNVTVTVQGDTVVEPDEDFYLRLSNAQASSGIAVSQAAGVILNDDSTTISVTDISVAEGNSGTNAANFVLTLSKPSASVVSVGYSTLSGTASAGVDFNAASGTASFAAGQTAMTVTVQVIGDTVDEDDETFTLKLASPVGASLTNASAVATILDDDTSALSVADLSQNEGNGGGLTPFVFAITLDEPNSRTVTVGYTTHDGTALASDFIAVSGTATFAPGQLTATVTVQVRADDVDEALETFTVDLVNAVHASITKAQGIGSIVSDDSQPGLAVSGKTVNGDAGTLDFVVSLSNVSSKIVTVDYATADGTAIAPDNYYATAGTLTFGPGQQAQIVTVVLPPGAGADGQKSFTLNLSNAANALLLNSSGTGTLGDSFKRSTLGKTVMAPVPSRKGEPVCLYFTSAPLSSTWKVYAVDRQLVAEQQFANEISQCWHTDQVAPGLYRAVVSIVYANGASETQTHKIVVKP